VLSELSDGEGGSVRLELDVDSPLTDDGFVPSPLDEVMPSEFVDPAIPRLDGLVPESVDPDKLDEPVGLDERLDGAGDERLDGAVDVDERELPLVPIEEPELGDNGLPLALLRLDESGLVELRLLLPVGLDTPGLGHGCWNGVGFSGGATGEVGLCTEPDVCR
jgi:hypothetical protein